jgi:hypothetical protein
MKEVSMNNILHRCLGAMAVLNFRMFKDSGIAGISQVILNASE